MIRITDIQNSMLHLIGWRQSYDTTEGTISEALTESESGLFYQDTHPLLTLQNLRSIAPDFGNYTYPEYDSTQSYKKGIVVVDDGAFYKSIKAVPAGTPITDTEYWMPTDQFSEWLEMKTRAAVSKAISLFVNNKACNGAYRVLCERKTLFDGTGRLCDKVKNKNNLVGFEITPIRSKGVTTKINRIGLQFTEPGTYTIFLMHSSLSEPYYTETFTKRNNSMEWFTPSEDIFLPYENDRIDSGGSWYLCYMQSELPANSQAIFKSRDWSKKPCDACSKHEYETWLLWSKYIEVHPFYVNGEFVETENGEIRMWDLDKNIYDYSTNYGLNLDITVSCDITDFIIEQKLLFTDYLSKSVAVDFLREFAYNPAARTNRHSINVSRPDVLYELDGDSTSMKQAGLGYQLELTLRALELNTQGIDRVCLPCANHGIKYTVV